MPGHIGILSYEGKSSLRKEATQAMIYHSGHEPLPLRSFKEGDYQMVKFKKEMTKGHFFNDHFDFYIDGEIYKDGVRLFLSCENEEDLLNSLKQIDGYFSATIFNKKKRQVHLVTDRYGMKPLYLFNQGKTTAWCSELKSLLSLDLSLSINVSNINLFLNSGFLPGNTTWYDHVELINPSALITIDLEDRSMDQHFYWKWAEKIMRPEWTLEEAISKIGELFDRSVSVRLNESQLNMVGLSGGLDSRFIAQVLGNASSTCFTFGHKGSDDVRLARKVSSILDIHHEFLEYHHDNWLKGKIMSVWRTEGMLPFFHLHASPFMEALHQMGDTVFNGFGGATLMGGLFLGKESKLRRQIGSLTSSKIEFYEGGQPESLVIDQHMRRFIHQGSVDLGKYHHYGVVERTGFNLWSRCQECDRWKLLNTNSFGHSTITVNGQLHDVEGKADIIDFKAGVRPEATIDITPALGGQLKQAHRRFVKDSPASLLIEDQLAVNDATQVITWQLITQADVALTQDGAMLSQDGERLKLEILSHPELRVSLISLSPPPLQLDLQKDHLKRLEIRIPAWTIKDGKTTLRVRLSGE